MKSIGLVPYEPFCLCSSKGKQHPPAYISALALGAADSLEGGLADHGAFFYTDAANAPMVWTARSGPRRVKGVSGMKAQTITHVVSDGPFTGIFLLSRKGVDFVLLEHAAGRPWGLRARPRSFSRAMKGLMAPCRARPSCDRKRGGAGTGVFIVYNAQLRHVAADKALILAALVRDTQEGSLHLLVGSLLRKQWRRWSVEEDYGINSGLYIDLNGHNVTLMRCTIAAPVGPAGGAVAPPNVPLSLSTFEPIESVKRCGEASRPTTLACVFYHETTIDCAGQHPPVCRTFQSLGFAIPPSAGDSCLNCPITVAVTSVPLFYFLVRVGCDSFILQLTRPSNKSELVAECFMLPASHRIEPPLAFAAMKLVEDSQQLNDSQVTFILTKDSKLLAFDGAIPVEVRVCFGVDATNDLKQIAQQMASTRDPAKHRGCLSSSNSRAGPPATGGVIGLLAVGQRMLLCTDGVLAVLLQIKSTALQDSSLHQKVMCLAADVLRPCDGEESVTYERSFGALSNILASESVSRQELSGALLRRILPTLRRVASTQIGVSLTRHAFVLLLHLVSPTTDAGWGELWTLVRVLQHVLRGDSRADDTVYTDPFFIDLADHYYRSSIDAKGQPQAMLKGLREVISHGAKRAVEGKVNCEKSSLPAEIVLFLDSLSERAPLLPFAEEVVRHCVSAEALSDGCVGAVQPKEGCGAVIYAMGLVLLGSCLNIPLYIGVNSEKNTIECSLEQGTTSCIYVQAHAISDQKSFEYALTLAVDLLCVQTSDFPYSLRIPIVVLAMSRRSHCLTLLLRLFSSKIVQDLQLDTLPDNTEWLEHSAVILNSSPDEVVRSLIQTQSAEGGLQGSATATALCYALCGSGLPVSLSVFKCVKELISQELCVASVAMSLFSVTEQLVDAYNNYAESMVRYLLCKYERDVREAEGASLIPQERFFSILERTLVAWTQANVLLPCKIQDIASNYMASISVSFSDSIDLTYNRGTVLFRTLVSCFRILVLLYYSQVLQQNLNKEVLLCEKAVASCSDITEGHPAVRGSLEALRVLHTLKDGGLLTERYQDQLLGLVAGAVDICVADTHLNSAPWSFFFVRVLSLSGISETSMMPLRKRYHAQLDRLQSRVKQLLLQETSEGGVRRCIEKAEATVHSLSLNDRRGKPAVHFIFSHSRDASVPGWISNHDLPGRKYLVTTDWTQRMWGMEGNVVPLKEANELLISCISEGAEKAALLLNEPDSNYLSIEQAKSLYENIYHIVFPTRLDHVVKGPALTCKEQDSHSLGEEERSIDKRGGEGDAGKGAGTAVVAPLRGGVSAPEDSTLMAEPKPMIEIPHAEETNLHTLLHPSTCAREGPALPSSNQFSPQDVAWWESLASVPHKGHDFTAGSTEEEPALSDTVTTCTTSTTQGLPNIDTPQQLRGQPSKTYYDNSNFGEELFSLSRASHHKTQCHHHHHFHAHCYCRCKKARMQLDPSRMQFTRRVEGDHSPLIIDAPPPLDHPPQFHRFLDLNSRGVNVQLPEFSTLLQPPLEPPRRGDMNDFSTPVRQRVGNILQGGKVAAHDCGRVPSLLTFPHRQNPQFYSPRARLYCTSLDNSNVYGSGLQQAAERVGATPSPFLDSLTARAPVQYLEPPPLPASDVLQKPPPLLHLHKYVVGAEPAATAVAANDPPIEPPSCNSPKSFLPVPIRPSVGDGTLLSAPEPMKQTQRLRPYHECTEAVPCLHFAPSLDHDLSAQMSRKPTIANPRKAVESVPVRPVASTPVFTYDPNTIHLNTEARPPLVPDVKQSVLTSSELGDFKCYVDNLVSKRDAAPVVPMADAIPRPTATSFSPSELAWRRRHDSPRPVAPFRPPQSTGLAGFGEFADPLGQSQELAIRAEDLPKQQGGESGAFGRRVPGAHQPTPVPVPLAPPPSSHPQRGLAVTEQGEPFQGTAKRTNELLRSNQEPFDTQFPAAWGGVGSTFKGLDTADAGRDRPLGSAQGEPQCQVQPFYDFIKPRLMPSPQVQTQSLTTSDAVAEALFLPVHAAGNMPPYGGATTAPLESVSETISDPIHFIAKLKGMNLPTGAAERTAHEVRGTIQECGKLKVVGDLGLAGAALPSSLRSNTAITERQLTKVISPLLAVRMQSELQDGRPKPQLESPINCIRVDHDEIAVAKPGAQQQGVTRPSSRWLSNFCMREINQPEKVDMDSAESHRSGVAVLETPSSNLLGGERVRKFARQSTFFAPWYQYQTVNAVPEQPAAFVAPDSREFIANRGTVYDDNNNENACQLGAAALSDKKSPLMNSQRALFVRYGTPRRSPHVGVASHDVTVSSPAEPTDLRAIYQAAPMRPSERIRHRLRRAASQPQHRQSVTERRYKEGQVGAVAHRSPSRAASRDAPDRFYMYRGKSDAMKAKRKASSGAKTPRHAAPFVTRDSAAFREPGYAAVSQRVPPPGDGGRPKAVGASVFMERQKRRRKDNIEQRIYRLEREFA